MYEVILNKDVTKTKGFIRTTFRDGSISELMRLERRGDRLILPFGEAETEVPPPLDWLVEEVSFMGDIPAVPHREYGVYRHESARAQVTKSRRRCAKAYIVGKTIADVRELYHRILAGSIRPEESYEKPQTGKSRKEMEAAFAKFKELAERFRRQDGRGWPFATKGGVADMIQEILHGGSV